MTLALASPEQRNPSRHMYIAGRARRRRLPRDGSRRAAGVRAAAGQAEYPLQIAQEPCSPAHASTRPKRSPDRPLLAVRRPRRSSHMRSTLASLVPLALLFVSARSANIKDATVEQLRDQVKRWMVDYDKDKDNMLSLDERAPLPQPLTRLRTYDCC